MNTATTGNSRISVCALYEVRAAMKEYRVAVMNSDLARSSQTDYLRKTEYFVKWLGGGYESLRKGPYRIRTTNPAA